MISIQSYTRLLGIGQVDAKVAQQYKAVPDCKIIIILSRDCSSRVEYNASRELDGKLHASVIVSMSRQASLHLVHPRAARRSGKLPDNQFTGGGDEWRWRVVECSHGMRFPMPMTLSKRINVQTRAAQCALLIHSHILENNSKA